jgi:Papain-like cysteine protease AvrRpt2
MKLKVDPALAWPYAAAPAERRASAAVLPMSVERQELSNWCWAAIAAALARHFKTGEFRQDEIAQIVERRNTTAALDDALRRVGCVGRWSPGRPPFEHIAAEIAQGRPLCVCIQWQSGDAHYVVVTGCHTDTREIVIEDSLHGPSVHPFDEFPRSYRGSRAVWRGVYWTSPMEMTS